jgi:hypothetical protein
MKITFPIFSIAISLATLFMIAGLYGWFILGVQVDQQHRQLEHNNMTKILSKQVDETQNITHNNRLILNAIYANVKASLSSQKNLNLTIQNHAILSDTNRIIHQLAQDLRSHRYNITQTR